MTKRLAVILCLGTFLLFACKDRKQAESKGSSAPAEGTSLVKPLDADTSYAFGMALGVEFKDLGLNFDYDAFVRGFREYIEGKETQFSIDEVIARVHQVYNEAVITQSKAAETAYLTENSKKPGIIVTPSGLQYEVITQGTGQKPQKDDTVQVHYTGTLLNGTVFDSSQGQEKPREFPLNRVIRGWTEGLQLMNEGSTYRFYIPSELAYGSQGGERIPPYATLIFEVELLSILK